MIAFDVRDLLPLHALRILDADDAEAVERAVARDPELAAELAAYQTSATTLITPIPPGPDVEARLMASVGAGRFARLASHVAQLYDVTDDRAHELLALIERPTSWELAAPGINLVHFDSGPAFAAADCGFVRIEPGATFPEHSHQGEEVSLVLTGQLRDADGRVLSPGDELILGEGSSHFLTSVGAEPCIFAARAMNGIAIAGAPVTPPGRK